MLAESGANTIRTKTFRVIAGILGVASFATAALLIAAAGPLVSSLLLLTIPFGLVFLQFSLMGRVTRSAWGFVGTLLILRVVAGLVDRHRCLDAGGAYGNTFEGCIGASPTVVLLLSGGGGWALWVIVLMISSILALLVFRAVTWADDVARAVKEHRANQDAL